MGSKKHLVAKPVEKNIIKVLVQQIEIAKNSKEPSRLWIQKLQQRLDQQIEKNKICNS